MLVNAPGHATVNKPNEQDPPLHRYNIIALANEQAVTCYMLYQAAFPTYSEYMIRNEAGHIEEQQQEDAIGGVGAPGRPPQPRQGEDGRPRPRAQVAASGWAARGPLGLPCLLGAGASLPSGAGAPLPSEAGAPLASGAGAPQLFLRPCLPKDNEQERGGSVCGNACPRTRHKRGDEGRQRLPWGEAQERGVSGCSPTSHKRGKAAFVTLSTPRTEGGNGCPRTRHSTGEAALEFRKATKRWEQGSRLEALCSAPAWAAQRLEAKTTHCPPPDPSPEN